MGLPALLGDFAACALDIRDMILDPFHGSGTTLLAAKNLDRRWIGIDESRPACTIARQRLATP